MRKAIDIILSTLILLMLAATIAAMALGVQIRAVLTDSMEPDIKVGTVIVAVPIAFEDLRIGDDIVYRKPGDPKITITHRIIDINPQEQTLTTKGVNAATRDPSILAQSVLGRVKYKIPYVGYLIMAVDTVWGKVVCVIAAALLIAHVIKSTVKEDPESEEKENFDVHENERQ